MSGRKFRAPSGDGEVFADPPLELIPQLLKSAQSFDLGGRTFGGLDFAEFRKLARREVLDLAGATTDAPMWFVAGHQPEFFHPGVWLKNFALVRIAKTHHAVGLNIIVDNDVPKSASVRVPVWRPGIAADDVSEISVPFDAPPPKDVAYEEWACQDVALRDSFAARLDEETKRWPFRIANVGTTTAAGTGERARNGEWMVARRRTREVAWGMQNAEVYVSQLAQTQAFVMFAEMLLRNADVIHCNYNNAVRIYRQRERLRGRHHPVPELTKDGDWIESPFWCWTSERPQRQRLFVRTHHGVLQIRWGETTTTWPDATIKLRPRALTLTMFARIALADVFVHGIGGGKYEELNDAIWMMWWGVELLPYVVLSGTLRLPLPRFPANVHDLHNAQRRERDLRWNPQRLFDEPMLAAQRRALLALPTTTRSQRRERNRQLRDNLRQWPLAEIGDRGECDRLESELRANQILADRDYPWLLYPEDSLHRFMDSLMV